MGLEEAVEGRGRTDVGGRQKEASAEQREAGGRPGGRGDWT